MAAPDGVVCAVAVITRWRETNGRAFEALQGPIPVPAAPELPASSWPVKSDKVAHTNVPIETDNDAGQGAGALSPRHLSCGAGD